MSLENSGLLFLRLSSVLSFHQGACAALKNSHSPCFVEFCKDVNCNVAIRDIRYIQRIQEIDYLLPIIIDNFPQTI